jgi:hypothetical protein
MVLLYWRSPGMPTSRLLITHIATGSVMLCRLDRYHRVHCARPPSSVFYAGWLRRWVPLCVEVAGSLLRRMVATEAGIQFDGRSYSSRDDRSLEDHRMIIPEFRVIGCAEESDGALAGFLDRDRMGCASGGPNNQRNEQSTTGACPLAFPLDD